jgi:heat shock protein HslJ
VTLTVTDENGLSSSANAAISISASLEETDWSLAPVQPESNITVEFSDGKLSGFGGCNDYSGEYITDTPDAPSGNLTVQNLASTRTMCEEEISAQESQYLTAFESVTAFTITGDSLTLTFPGGALAYEALRAQPR